MANNPAAAFEWTRGALTRGLFSPLSGMLMGDWLNLVGRCGLDLPPRYWPKAMFTTVASALNSTLARVEHRRYAAQLDELQVKSPIFVLGHHRSGTTHLWNVLMQDPGFSCPSILQAVFPHTFLLFERVIRGPALLLGLRKRPQDNMSIHPDGPVEEERALCTSTLMSIQLARHFPRQREQFERFLTMRETTRTERTAWKSAFERFARKLSLRHGAEQRLVFKSPDHTAKIRLLLELFPRARFVHIHRHPYSVFASTRAMEHSTQPIYAYQPQDANELDEFILWRYRTMYEAFFEDVQAIPEGQFFELAYEDLCRQPLAAMQRLYRQLGLPGFAQVRPGMQAYLDSLAGYQKNRHQTLTASLRERIHREWRPSFEQWCYAP